MVAERDDLTAYLRGEADSDARWRVEYRLQQLDAAVPAQEER